MNITIYDYVSGINNDDNVLFRVFDLNTEENVGTEMTKSDICDSEYADYDVESVDMWFDRSQNSIVIELNVEIDNDENFFEE